MPGSTNRPGLVTSAKCVSKTWTPGSPLNPLTTSRCARSPLCLGTRARPVENAGSIRASVDVVVGAGAGTLLQPVILPSGAVPASSTKVSLNRKRAGVSVPAWLITKSEVGLKTMPVGEDAVHLERDLRDGVHAVRARVEGDLGELVRRQAAAGRRGLNWLLTHSGVAFFFGPKAMPHGFLTAGSRRVAIPGMSDTRLTWRNMPLSLPPFAVAAAFAPVDVVAAIVATRPSARTRAAPPRRWRPRPLGRACAVLCRAPRTAPALSCLMRRTPIGLSPSTGHVET